MKRFTTCLKKKRYTSEEFAEHVARKIKRERGVDVRTYYCPTCCGYHHTKKLEAGANDAGPTGDRT